MTAHRVLFKQTQAAETMCTYLGRARPFEVIVVGAGTAGLSAACTILKERPDTDLVILESNREIGGNAASVRVGNHTASAGVLYFSSEVGGALKEYDIQAALREIPDPAEGGFIGRGRFITGFYEHMRDSIPRFAKFCKDLGKLAKKIGDPLTDSPLNERAHELDRQTAADFLEPYGAETKAVLNPYCRAAFGAATDYISAAALLCYFAFEEAPKCTIESGGYGLASVMGSHVNKLNPGGIVTQAPVTKIENQHDGMVEVTGSTFRVFAKAVIVTTPLAHARQIIKHLSPEKTAIIERMPKLPYLVHNVGPLERSLLGAYTGWTPGFPFPAIVNNTWGIEGVTDHSIRISDPLEIGASLDKNSVRSRQREVFDSLCQLFPKIREMKHVTVQTRVYRDPFPFIEPGYLSKLALELRIPEADGRIVYAGQIAPCTESAIWEGRRGARHVIENVL